MQRSIKIGVTDYLLKNELNSRMLRELLEKMEGVLDSDGEKQSLIRQHNYKQFLLSESGKEVYPNIGKKRERIVAVSFMLLRPIWLNVRKNPAKRKEISCYELEKLDYPEGAACRCIVEMNVNEFAGIFCLEEFIADESGVIRRAVECIQERLAQIGLPPFSYVVSETTYTPLDIPTRYREVRRLQNYLYRFGTAYGKGGIYWQSGLRDKREAAEPMDGRRAAFLEMVQEENFEAAREELSKIFELAKRGRDVWEYAEEMKNIVRNLNEYVARNHVNVEEYEMAYEHENTQSLEDMIMGYLGEISEAVGETREKHYSRYTKQAIEYMQEHYAEDIVVPDIAEAIGISEGHLRKVFKQEMDVKIIDFLTDYRLEKAKRYMQRGEHVLDAIWKKTGFASAQYFSYVFKKKEGMAPREYIKRNLQA